MIMKFLFYPIFRFGLSEVVSIAYPVRTRFKAYVVDWENWVYYLEFFQEIVTLLAIYTMCWKYVITTLL